MCAIPTIVSIEGNQGVGGPAPAVPHNGRDNPTNANAPCPFNMFRTGGDIVPDFGVVIDKLQRTVRSNHTLMYTCGCSILSILV